MSDADAQPFTGQHAATRGRWVRLRPLVMSDIEQMYFNEVGGPQSWWRLRGVTPSLASFADMVWSSVTVQFAVCPLDSVEPLGVVFAYNSDTRNGHAYLGISRFVHEGGLGAGLIEGAGLVVDYLFLGWPYRKLYMETDSLVSATFRSAFGRVFDHEATLRQHLFFRGQHLDLVVYSLSRERWDLRRRELGFDRLQQPVT